MSASSSNQETPTFTREQYRREHGVVMKALEEHGAVTIVDEDGKPYLRLSRQCEPLSLAVDASLTAAQFADAEHLARADRCRCCGSRDCSTRLLFRPLVAEVRIARAWHESTDDDRPLPEDEAIKAAHPTQTNTPEAHDRYGEAMRLVGARRSKGGLIALVNWLLADVDAMRDALELKFTEHNEELLTLERSTLRPQLDAAIVDIKKLRTVAKEARDLIDMLNANIQRNDSPDVRDPIVYAACANMIARIDAAVEETGDAVAK